MLLTNARIIDGTGAPPRPNQAVLLDGKKIAAVGPEESLEIPPDTPRLDLGGMTLLPGLIDCHVHIWGNPDPYAPPQRRTGIPIRDDAYFKSRNLLFALRAAQAALESGFTTVQDLMAPNDLAFPLRDAIDDGEFVAARLRSSGKCITLTGGHGTETGYADMTIVADGPREVLKAVRAQIAAGADVIKYMGGTRAAFSPPFRGRPGYTTKEMRVGVEEAHRAGLRVAVHAHSNLDGIKNSIRAGVDSIEHGFPIDDEALEMMAERGTYLCPTLSVNPAALDLIDKGLWPYKGSENQLRALADELPKVIAGAKRHGVKIALGTDAAMPGVYHGKSAGELELLVEYGLTPMEALVAATRNAAENIGMLDKIGTIEPGKLADLVVVAGDPLDDIRVLQDLSCIPLVFKEGAIVVDRRAQN